MKNHDHLDIDRIAFIGRTYAEYRRMFNLDPSMPGRARILDCAAGPSSFTAEACRDGLEVTACDVLYDIPGPLLLEKGRKDIEHVFDRLDEVRHLYTWKYYRNKEEIIAFRHKALELFSQDFPGGLADGRYIHAGLPRLPFRDRQFDLVLSSHFLFLYGDRLDFQFHKAAMKELVRVCSGEARIFPLQGLDAKPYPRLKELMSYLESERIEAEIIEVDFEFQKGSNKMMRLSGK